MNNLPEPLSNLRYLSTFVSALKKNKQNISKIFLRGTLLFGVIVAFLSISTSTTQLSPYVCDGDQQEQESPDDGQSKSQEVVKAFEAIPVAAQTSLNHEFLLLDILPELEEADEEIISAETPEFAGSKVLRILFRRIISPNAP